MAKKSVRTSFRLIPIIVIALIVGAYLSLSLGAPSVSVTTTSNTYTNPSIGLELRLGVKLTAGRNIQINVSEFNTLTQTNNVSVANLWKITNPQLEACGHSIYPFGVALFQGRYTVENLSQGKQLQIFPTTPCPLLIRLITGYLFQPLNNSAIVLPAGSGSPSVPMFGQVNVTSVYVGKTSQPLSQGVYTVVAGDEWGGLAIVYVTV